MKLPPLVEGIIHPKFSMLVDSPSTHIHILNFFIIKKEIVISK
jgi:hypothetical protein